MSPLEKLSGKDIKIDFSRPVFFAEQFRQKGYDLEIDEGMSSGMKRYVTLDVTELSEGQVGQLIGRLRGEAQDFSLCKLVRIAGFVRGDKRYLIVSGESHEFYQVPARDTMLDKIRPVTEGLPVEYVEAYVAPPTPGEQSTLTTPRLKKEEKKGEGAEETARRLS
jgi:hypothetical protein